MELDLHISEDTRVPVYLQVKYQLAYLIRSGRLEVGARLPAVRSLAATLKISTGTVIKAYAELRAEGYLEGRSGRGTAVASPRHSTEVAHSEARLLAEESLGEAFRYAYALGFDKDEISQLSFSLLQRTERTLPIAVAGSTSRMSERYAEDLKRSLGLPEVEVRPVTANPIGSTGKWEIVESQRSQLDDLYYIVTFTTFVDEVVDALGERADRYKVLGLPIEPTAETSERLGALALKQKACFVASPKFFHSFVPFIRSQLLLPYTSLHMIRDSQDGLEDLERAIDGADVIVHNVGLSSMLDQLGVPEDRRVELEFRFAPEAIEELQRVLRMVPSHRAQPALLREPASMQGRKPAHSQQARGGDTST